jgi:vancomycin aglycone glucosyltransferase
MAPDRPLRLALAVEGTRGDVDPLCMLGRGLESAGHSVVLCGPPDFASHVRAHGLAFHPVGIHVRDFLTQEAATMHAGPLAVARRAQKLLCENLPIHADGLLEATEGADALIASGTMVAAASVAEARGIAYRYVVYCPALMPSAEHGPATFPWQTLSPRVNRASWRVTRTLMNASVRGALRRLRSRLGLGPHGDAIRHVLGAHPLLAADPGLAPVPKDVGPVTQVAGLQAFDDQAALPEKLQDFLDAGDPPAYIGFGSVTDPAPRQTTRLLLDAIAGSGVRALVSEGWSGLGDGPLPDGVMQVGALPHGALFRRVMAVVHHGGAGTTLTAARAGAPQIVIPHWLDQHYWGERVRRLGLGPPPLPRNRLAADALAEALRSLHGNEWVSVRAAELGRRLRAELADADPTRGVLEDLELG